MSNAYAAKVAYDESANLEPWNTPEHRAFVNAINEARTARGQAPIPTYEKSKDSGQRNRATDKPATGIDKTLDERGARYGKFTGHAEISQRLKEAMRATPKWSQLKPDQMEALEMVAHKIGRILNGDPDYDDSWVDVAGYSKLVADRLQGVQR